MKKYPFLSLLSILLLSTAFVLGNANAATIYTDFEGASNHWNGYQGAAGGGWKTAWSQKNSSNDYNEVSATVKGSEGSKYLEVSHHTNVSSGGIRAGISRRVDSSGDLDFTKNYTVSFDLYFPDVSIFEANDMGSLSFAQTADDKSNGTLSMASSVWYFQVFSNRGSGSNSVFQISSAYTQGSDISTTITLGTPLVSATTYHISVAVNPFDKLFQLTIETDIPGYTSVSSPWLKTYGSANGSTALPNDPWLNFQGTLKYLSGKQDFTYQLNNIEIVGIPEPGSIALLLSAAVLLGGWIRWKRVSRSSHS